MIKINGMTLRSPKSLQANIYDVSKTADRNAEGTMMIDIVASKRKLEIEWGPLTPAQSSAILTAVQSKFFSVTYPDPETGADKTITCYKGDRTSPIMRYTAGVPLWSGLKMSLIEQ